MKIIPGGGRSLIIEFGNEISPEMNRRVVEFTSVLEKARMAGVMDILPTYRSIQIGFDPKVISCEALTAKVEALASADREIITEESQKHIVEIPCCYGGEYGPDLANMAKSLNISEEEIIHLHAEVLYPVYMMGFLPGFPYLGGLNEQIHMPRLSSPRKSIPAGSVGIGGSQTGIYPMESPGGWQLIGRTPLTLYDPNREQPVLLQAGDYVQFVPITGNEYVKMSHGDRHPGSNGDVSMSRGDRHPGSPKLTAFGKMSQGACPHSSFRIEAPGPLTTVQDGGRYGYLKAGITECGAMDRNALELANLLVGNEPGAAALEATMMGPQISFTEPCYIAITGADMKPELSGQRLPMNKKIEVWAGDVLSFSFAEKGLRTYIAFRGGIDVPLVMGSRSTDLKGRLGGFEGRKLQAGDELSLGKQRRRGISFAGRRIRQLKAAGRTNQSSSSDQAGRSSRTGRSSRNGQSSGSLPGAGTTGNSLSIENGSTTQSSQATDKPIITVHAVPGPQANYFTEEARMAFSQAIYTISGQSDRMGIRLEGAPVASINGTDIISDGITFGSVQVPANGQPIILMADHQTTGGYAKIATIVYEDLPKLAQARPGDRVQICWR